MKKFRYLSAGLMMTSALILGTGFSFSGVNAMAASLPNSPYTVASGDTLYSIAKLATFPINELLKVNHFTLQTTIYPGEKVALPFVYKVQSGDALWYLAHQYQTTISSIKALNGLKSDVIYPGMKLLIARGSKLIKGQSQHLVFAAANTSTSTGNQNTAKATSSAAVSTQPSSTVISAVATAYDSSVASNGPYGAVDYFGDPLKFGDIAVDPSVIPLGSKVFISGYSDSALPKGGFYATAVDTGGAIKGDRIDIYLPSTSAAIDFGIEHVKVTVFKN